MIWWFHRLWMAGRYACTRSAQGGAPYYLERDIVEGAHQHPVRGVRLGCGYIMGLAHASEKERECVCVGERAVVSVTSRGPSRNRVCRLLRPLGPAHPPSSQGPEKREALKRSPPLGRPVSRLLPCRVRSVCLVRNRGKVRVPLAGCHIYADSA